MIKTFSITDIGKCRKMNQDFVFSSEEPIGNLPNLFIVADGMGGHKAGDYASKYAVETICKEAEISFERNPVKILYKAINVANEHIYEKSVEDEDYRGMGTTVCCATILGKYLHVANVGDSRLYIINGDTIQQITRDHSYVQEMIARGEIDPMQAKNHPKKNIITRAVGGFAHTEAEFFNAELQEGDIILICSDGLSNMIEDEEIRMIVNGQRDIVERAEKLVSTANSYGGKDNISVILIEPFANDKAQSLC